MAGCRVIDEDVDALKTQLCKRIDLIHGGLFKINVRMND